MSFVGAVTLAFGMDVPVVALEPVVDTLGSAYNFIATNVLPRLEPYLR